MCTTQEIEIISYLFEEYMTKNRERSIKNTVYIGRGEKIDFEVIKRHGKAPLNCPSDELYDGGFLYASSGVQSQEGEFVCRGIEGVPCDTCGLQSSWESYIEVRRS